jgi:hypothetical protein
MCTSKADRTIFFVANGEDQAMRDAINHSIGTKPGFAVVEPIIPHDG